MKHKLLGRILAVLMAASMVVPAFAADYVAAVTHAGEDLDTISDNQKYTQEQFEEGTYNDELIEGSGNTLHILDSINVSGTVYVDGSDTTVDLHENTLTVSGMTEDGAVSFDCPGGSTIQNGNVVLGAPDDEDAETPDAVIKGGQDDVNIKNVNVKTEDDVEVKAAFSTGHGTITVENSVVDVGDAPVFGENMNAGPNVTGNAVSGVFYGPMNGEDDAFDVKIGQKYDLPSTGGQPSDDPSGTPGTGEPAKKTPTVIVSDSTAAVVVDKDGNVKLYDSLEDAKEAVGTGAVVNVVKDTNVPEGFKVENGKLVEDKKEPVNPNPPGPGTVEPPVIVPGIEGPGLMDGPTVEIDDPDVPLAGLPITLAPEDKLTRGMLMSILHWMDSAPAAELSPFTDVAADSSYAVAIGWASANGIAKGVSADKFAPKDAVTRGQLVTFLNRYAAYAGSSVTVELDGDADEIITWAVAEEIISDFFARLYA